MVSIFQKEIRRWIMVPSITFLVIGIKLSAKYALYAVAIEISLMMLIVILSFVMTRGGRKRL